jgi:DNA repair exonuclease SbcCD ATPase subunit
MELIEQIEEYNEKLTKMRGAESVLNKQLKELKQEEKEMNKEILAVQKAKVIAQTVAQQTQQKITFHINNLITSGLEAVFPEPYKFELRFTTRRNKTEADMLFIKNGNEVDDILSSGGGGVADIASYLLSIAVYSINPTRPIFVRDENFKFLHSEEFQEKASLMIKKVSEKFGIQMILISDQEKLYQNADNVIRVKIKDGVSYIEQN